MRRLKVAFFVMVLPLVAAAVLLPMAASGAQGGLSPAQLNSQGWTCFNVPGLGVHCSPPGQEFPPTGPHAQLLYFFTTTDVNSTTADFTGTETLIRDDKYHGQPCPTQPGGANFIGDLGGGFSYWACHRR